MALRSRKCSFQESNSFSCFFNLSWMLGDNVASYGQHCGLRYCLFHMYLCCEKRALVFHIVDSPIHVATKNEGFPGSSVVKNPPALQEPQETQVRSLGWEDPLEEEMATHFSILAWKNPMDRGAWWATVHGVVKSRTRPTTTNVCGEGLKAGTAGPRGHSVGQQLAAVTAVTLRQTAPGSVAPPSTLSCGSPAPPFCLLPLGVPSSLPWHSECSGAGPITVEIRDGGALIGHLLCAGPCWALTRHTREGDSFAPSRMRHLRPSWRWQWAQEGLRFKPRAA